MAVSELMGLTDLLGFNLLPLYIPPHTIPHPQEAAMKSEFFSRF